MKRIVFTLLLLLAGLSLRAQLRFDSCTFDMKIVFEDDAPSEYTFRYANRSDEPVVILRAETTCGCAKPRYTKEPVMPGQSGSISVTFYPKGHPGALNRSVFVHTSAPPKPVRLTLTGHITPTTENIRSIRIVSVNCG